MYLPTHFAETDESVLLQFMDRYGFATVVTHADGELLISHVPLLLRQSGGVPTVVGHVARANPHWRAMDGQKTSLVIFQGPHGYVSPRWYKSSGLVPTWNYSVVHATGIPEAREDQAFAATLVGDLTRRYEPAIEGWRVDDLLPEHLDKLLTAIVPFEMPISRVEGKFKLSQNRSAADREGVIAGLDQTGECEAMVLAELMRASEGRLIRR